MADNHGRRPRWTAAALLAPASAAVFAASMSWVTGESASAATASTSSQPSVNPLQAALDHRTAQVAALRAQVKGLQEQLAQAGPAPSAPPAVTPTGSAAPKVKATTAPAVKTTRNPATTAATKTKVTTAPAVTKTTTKAPPPPPVVTTTTRAS
jgi:hypothetical protein